MQLEKLVTRNGNLYRENAAGEVFVWIPTPVTGLGELGGLWKKLKRLPKRTFKAITKTTIGRTAIRIAGTVAAPWTGGLSLAAAEAAARYGKARYTLGLSRGAAFRRGAVGGVVGGALGYGVSRAYGAFIQPGATAGVVSAGAPGAAVTPSMTPWGGVVSAGAPVSSPFGTVIAAAPAAVTPTVSVIPSLGNVLKITGEGIMSVVKAAGTVLPVLASTGVMQRGTPGAVPEHYDSGIVSPAPFESNYGSGGGGGGGWPSGVMPPEPDVIEEGGAVKPPSNAKFAIAGALAAAGGFLLYVSMGKGK
jgi:hypothetical protein